MKTLQLILLGLTLSSSTFAQTLVQYFPDASDANPSGGLLDSVPLPPDVTGANVVASDLAQSLPGGFVSATSDQWPVSSPGPFDINRFLTFSIEPTADNVVNLIELTYRGLSFADTTVELVLRSSLDNFSSNIGSETSTGSAGRTYLLTFDLSGLPRNLRQPLELRLYPLVSSGPSDFMDLFFAEPGAGLTVVGTSEPQGSMVDYRFDRLYPALQKPWYFAGIGSVAVNSDGFVYVTDAASQRILKFTESGRLTSVWGPQGMNGEPLRLALDSRQDLYVSFGNGEIEKFDPNGNFLVSFTAGGPRITFDPDDVLYAAQGNEIFVLMPPADASPTSPHVAERTMPLPFVSQIEQMDSDAQGNIYLIDTGSTVSDQIDGRVLKISSQGQQIWQQGQGPTQGLLAYYPFERNNFQPDPTLVADVSGNGHDGSLSGTADFNEGVFGSGLELSTGNGWVDINSSVLDGLPQCSVSFWIKLNSNTPGDPTQTCCNAVISQDGFTPLEVNQRVDAAQNFIEFVPGIGNTPPRITADLPPVPFEWIHYIYSYDSVAGTSRLYADNVEVAFQQHQLPAASCGSGNNMTIGAGLDGTTRWMDGRLDELRFYDRVITPSERTSLNDLAQFLNEFGPFGLQVSDAGEVYVADRDRMLIFDADGNYLRDFSVGAQRFFSSSMSELSFAPGGSLYGQLEGDAVRQISAEGMDLQEWSQQSGEPGRFNELRSVVQDSQGFYYAASLNLTKLDENLNFVNSRPLDIAAIDVGNNDRLILLNDTQVVALDPPASPTDFHTEVAQLDLLSEIFVNNDARLGDIAIGPSGLVYVTSFTAEKIFKMNQDLQLISIIPTPGILAEHLAIDSSENLYLIQIQGDILYKFQPPADVFSTDPHILDISRSGIFGQANGIAVSAFDEILVADRARHEISVFDTSLNRLDGFGEQGFDYGFFEQPERLEFGKDGQLIVIEGFLKRFQVFRPAQPSSNTARAIIVAGGGPFAGNPLWNATQVNANFAYRTLLAQGYTPESIFYLSADEDLDITGNGESDVDAGLSNANLRSAFETFALGASDLVVYLVDHGGADKFLMNGSEDSNETLDADVLAGWVNTWQASQTDASLAIIYDACQSGSFVDDLRKSSGQASDRIVIASSTAEENAYFASQGAASFSNHFWTGIFNGKSIVEAFDIATANQLNEFQTPLLEADGVAGENTAGDQVEAGGRFIGRGVALNSSAPLITDLSLPQTVDSGNSATLTAFGVTDFDGINRVWGVISPPAFIPSSLDNPVVDLPTVEFSRIGETDDFSATYDQFSIQGTYRVSVFAEDADGNIAEPLTTAITIGQPARRRAIIVAGSSQGFGNGSAINDNANLAYRALVEQGYGQDGIACNSVSCDNIQYLNAAGSLGVDLAPSLEEIEFSITQWATGNGQNSDPGLDLVVYLVGNHDGNGFVVGNNETLLAEDLNRWLQTAQSALPFSIVVIYDGESSGQFLPVLRPPTETPWIIITTDDDAGQCNLVLESDISFSRLFWPRILDGATILDAFRSGDQATRQPRRPRPQLDSTGDGIAGGFRDGIFPNNYRLGSGVLLAGDSPIVGGLNLPGTVSGNSMVTVELDRATSTGTITKVEAVITTPNCQIERLILQPSVNGKFAVATEIFGTQTGDYDVSVYAFDDGGRTSEPVTASISQSDGSLLFADGFE